MPKFVVRGADKPEEIVEFWLEQEGDWIVLHAKSGGPDRAIAAIRADGILWRAPSATGIPGLQYDDRGRIKEVE